MVEGVREERVRRREGKGRKGEGGERRTQVRE